MIRSGYYKFKRSNIIRTYVTIIYTKSAEQMNFFKLVLSLSMRM